VIFGVGIGVGPEEDPTRFVVAVLAAEVEWREAGPVDGVDVGLLLSQDRYRLRVAPPGRLVQRAVAVLFIIINKNENHFYFFQNYSFKTALFRLKMAPGVYSI
jgi:hypothetical protein